MDPKDIAIGVVEPRDDDDLVTDGEAVEAIRCPGVDFDPGIGGPLRSLHGGFAAGPELGADHADRSEPGFPTTRS